MRGEKLAMRGGGGEDNISRMKDYHKHLYKQVRCSGDGDCDENVPKKGTLCFLDQTRLGHVLSSCW